jgi:hypothetical protein
MPGTYPLFRAMARTQPRTANLLTVLHRAAGTLRHATDTTFRFSVLFCIAAFLLSKPVSFKELWYANKGPSHRS